jgi:hypothetical protein
MLCVLARKAARRREENIERELDGEKDITCRSERVDM